METDTSKSEVCHVCGDKASGKHYGVPSCDGCRGFFKRSIRRNLAYVCKDKRRCVVDVSRRNHCQACRFAKCLRANMRRESVQHERVPRPSRDQQQLFPLNQTTHTITYPTPRISYTGAVPFHPYNLRPIPNHESHTANNSHFVNYIPYTNFPRPSDPLTSSFNQTNSLINPQYPLNAWNTLQSFPFIPPSFPYPMTQPAYIAPPIVQPTVAPTPTTSTAVIELPSTSQLQEKPVFQISDKINDDEVSSSGEACKIDSTEDVSDRGPESAPNNEVQLFDVFDRDENRTLDLSTRNIPEETAEKRQITIKQNDNNRVQLALLEMRRVLENVPYSEHYSDPGWRIMRSCFNWLWDVKFFKNLERNKQVEFLCGNWKILALITTAQMEITIDAEQLSQCDIIQDSPVRDDIPRIASLLKKIQNYQFDHHEFDALKLLTVFRCEDFIDTEIDIQEIHSKVIIQLQNYCKDKECNRFVKIMALVSSISVLSTRRTLESIIFRMPQTKEIKQALTYLMFSLRK